MLTSLGETGPVFLNGGSAMRYSHLKNANVDVSQLAVGTWAMGGDSFGDNDDIASSMRAIRTMLEWGGIGRAHV